VIGENRSPQRVIEKHRGFQKEIIGLFKILEFDGPPMGKATAEGGGAT
jgi:hypothetical protein